jgi:GNAT superfamily N-acetyltransferase
VAVEIDWWPVARLGELQELIDGHWRSGHVLARDAELLRWQHGDGDGRLSVLGAYEDGRPVGMLGFIEFDACVGDERVRGGWMTTWLVVPEARGGGLGLRLVEHVLGSRYEFIGALAANSATRHVLGRYGFAERGMHRWVRVFDVAALRRLLADAGYPEEAWDAWSRPAEPKVASSDLLQGMIGACRDEAFLRWRYEEHPRFRYEVLRDESGFAAYRLERVRDSEATVMRIVDFRGGSSLAQALAAAAGRAGVVFADFSCTSAQAGASLEAAGFQREDRLPAELPGRFQPLDFSDRPIVSCFWAVDRLGVDFQSDDLYVTRADSDLDRPN